MTVSRNSLEWRVRRVWTPDPGFPIVQVETFGCHYATWWWPTPETWPLVATFLRHVGEDSQTARDWGVDILRHEAVDWHDHRLFS